MLVASEVSAAAVVIGSVFTPHMPILDCHSLSQLLVEPGPRRRLAYARPWNDRHPERLCCELVRRVGILVRQYQDHWYPWLDHSGSSPFLWWRSKPRPSWLSILAETRRFHPVCSIREHWQIVSCAILIGNAQMQVSRTLHLVR